MQRFCNKIRFIQGLVVTIFEKYEKVIDDESAERARERENNTNYANKHESLTVCLAFFCREWYVREKF